MRVLVVEDERRIAGALQEGLQAEGYDVAVETTGAGAFFRTLQEAFDLILLDLGLPDRDGLDVLAAIRAHAIRVPVMVLTARDTVQERVAALDAGADDYLVKPFAFGELLARMRSLLRRDEARDLRTAVGTLSIDHLTRRATCAGRPIDLTVKEFDLLEELMRYEGQVVSRETLVREVWPESSRSATLDNVIDAHMARLRRKVEHEWLDGSIQTVRGVGFMLKANQT